MLPQRELSAVLGLGIGEGRVQGGTESCPCHCQRPVRLPGLVERLHGNLAGQPPPRAQLLLPWGCALLPGAPVSRVP